MKTRYRFRQPFQLVSVWRHIGQGTVEPFHDDDGLHRVFGMAADLSPSEWVSRQDRPRAEIQALGRLGIQADLFLADRAPFFRRREVHEGITDVTLHLVDAVRQQKDQSTMGRLLLRHLPAVIGWVREKGNDRVLQG